VIDYNEEVNMEVFYLDNKDIKQITEYLLLEQKINKARKELDKYD